MVEVTYAGLVLELTLARGTLLNIGPVPVAPQKNEETTPVVPFMRCGCTSVRGGGLREF